MLFKLEKFFDRFADLMGWIAGVLNIVMLMNVFYDSIMRYFFRTGSIAMQELEWHLFAVVFLFGMAFTLKEDGHVRVDILYDHFSPRTKAAVNIGGTLFLLLPLSILIINGSTWYVHESYSLHEVSGDPGGLPYRWLIKAMIPTAFVFLSVSATGFVLHNINIFRGVETSAVRHEDEAPKPPPREGTLK